MCAFFPFCDIYTKHANEYTAKNTEERQLLYLHYTKQT